MIRHAVAALLAATSLAPIAQAAPVDPVPTQSGAVAGVAEGGVTSWKCIPFAAPPVGDLRWRAPQAPTLWSGVRAAATYGHDCMQLPFGGDAAPLGTEPAEDCLYLNIWRPSGGFARVPLPVPLPVLVWIYGGGFVNGGASPPTYAGANMARAGVVFVSFNYRLGRFGTFAHPALTAADADHGLLGNYGYLDQIAALHWVQHNIAAFGGDPARVTIMGESAGGMSIHALLTSPLAAGLFGGAVIMSGGDGVVMAGDGTLAGAETLGAAFAARKGIAGSGPGTLAQLRALSAAQVVDGLNLIQMFAPGPHNFSSPFVDGKIAVDAPAAYALGGFAHVPVMVGATSGDIGGPGGMMIAGASHVAGVLAAKGVPLWEYRFSYSAESLHSSLAGHASDIPFFLDNAATKYGAATTAKDAAMGHIISAYIANFVKTGDPAGGDLPAWPRYDHAGAAMMDFSGEGTAVARTDTTAKP